ncbi:UDP-N-acetylmuramate--L-alanine ligase [Clostridiaceae bacterium]|nr:UDP-N-acetylmuramate--L-alanine ligase [Clostridiaceae bacterium]NBI83413.1 UDP-N-acetylmuramate--L-alanine ligase [Clostridiaceae bacterium]
MAVSLQRYIQEQEIIHLIGIGGVSMSSLAELLLSQGVHVTGSDRQESAVTERLERLGARITYAHLPENVDGAALVIRTAAVHDDNFEVIRARERGIPVIERAEAWGALMADYDNVVCLAGTHGKTTSTSMMTMIALEAGLDPTVMVGSYLPAIGGTLRIGGHGCFIAESCEYCNSFLSFRPTIAVVLNVEEDHLDFFKDIDDIVASFRRFCALVPEDGLVVANADDPNAVRSVRDAKRVVTFGESERADVRAVDVTSESGYYRFTVLAHGRFYAEIQLSVPGRHNMMNALACCAAAAFLGVPGEVAARGLGGFTGSSRRFQVMGKTAAGAVVADDYAHHPSEMEATLRTARQMGFRKIFCAFQPHTYSRTKALFDDFVAALKLCDRAVLAPIYAAREKNTIGITSAELAAQVPGAAALNTFDEIAATLAQEAGEGDLILTMGAGDINTVCAKLLR